MAAEIQLDRTFHFVLETFVRRGHAPHYTEVAARFGVAPEEGKRLLRDVIATGGAMWLHPGTDLVASFAPFSNLPTQYRVSVDGRPGWFAQCGFEALALCWMFPGSAVRIDAPCLDCGEPLRVVVRDGTVESRDPGGIACYADLPFRDWARDWPYT